MPDAIAEHGVIPLHRPQQLPRIRVYQQLLRVEAVPPGWLVRPVCAVAVDQAWLRIRQITVPDLVGAFRQWQALHFPATLRVEQAELHLPGMTGEDGEVHSRTIEMGAQRPGFPRFKPVSCLTGGTHRSSPRVLSSGTSISVDRGGSTS